MSTAPWPAPSLLRFGKSSGPLLRLKQDFFHSNPKLLAENLRHAAAYVAQPARRNCKICDHQLNLDQPLFVKHGVPYVVCPGCSHLNGGHDDTEEFARKLYTGEGGRNYAVNYASIDRAAYMDRVRDIYLPKVHFLFDALRADGCDPLGMTYTDFGSGSGYNLAALLQHGIRAVEGYEVSEAQAELATIMVPDVPTHCHRVEDSVSLLSMVTSEVVVLLGVLEHLHEPRAALQALQANPAVKYVYFCVPMFSLSVYLETIFPNVMSRQLAGGHTHLFTLGSLAYILREFGLSSVGEWWFGTDLVDLYRDVSVSLAGQSERANEAWQGYFRDMIDALQLEIDGRRQSSQVHMLVRFAGK